MIRIVLTLLCTTIIFLSSCSDESDTAYTGPWIIHYHEDFKGQHNDIAHKEWFHKHQSSDFMITAELSPNQYWSDYFEVASEFQYDYYNHLIGGTIDRTEIIEKATNSEMQSLVNEFVALTIPTDSNGYFRKCKAEYIEYTQPL